MRLVIVLEVEKINHEPFREWLLHCTLVPWFEYVGDVNNLCTELKKIYKNASPIQLEGEENALFGRNHTLPVTKIKRTKNLHKVHLDTIKLLREHGTRFQTSYGDDFTTEQFIEENYIPHVTQHGGRKLDVGEKKISEAIYLVKSVGEKPKLRQTVDKFILGEKRV